MVQQSHDDKKSITLVEEVVNKIIQNVSILEWKLGERLPSEAELARMFSVSRNTIRAALSRLNASGVVETRHGSGSYVRRTVAAHLPQTIRQYTDNEIEAIANMLEFREALEPQIAYYASKRRNRNDLIDLKQCVFEMQEYRDNPQSYTEADTRFHLCMAKATANDCFYTTMLGLSHGLYDHFFDMNRSIGTDFSAEDHLRVYNAIEEEDADTARKLMFMIIDRSLNVFRK